MTALSPELTGILHCLLPLAKPASRAGEVGLLELPADTFASGKGAPGEVFIRGQTFPDILPVIPTIQGHVNDLTIRVVIAAKHG